MPFGGVNQSMHLMKSNSPSKSSTGIIDHISPIKLNASGEKVFNTIDYANYESVTKNRQSSNSNSTQRSKAGGP